MQTDIGAIEIDNACLWLGRRAEKNLANGEDPLPKKKNKKFADPRLMGLKPVKKAKLKPDGTL
ncbi:MAG TPA: hypothetical protein DCG54_07635 [Anaerolineae bacterium]|jgi:hypothetical protein|nr:hypothetical protein [Anaerolineae bacterium]